MTLLNIDIRNNEYKKLEDLCKEVDSSFTLTKIKFQIQAGVLELVESTTEPKKDLKGFLYLDSTINDFEKTEEVWVRVPEGSQACLVVKY